MAEIEQMNIHQKMLAIADAAGILQKSKKGYNFNYTPEEDIQAKVTAGMQKYGIMLYHSIVPGTMKVQPISYEKYDPKIKGNKIVNEVLVTADTLYRWVNASNPEEVIEVPWALVGQMEDASQAFGAAETYCNRYFLMKSLQLATSELDPDDYRSKQKAAENYDLEKEEKAYLEQLNAKLNEVKSKGSELINQGTSKEAIMNIVASHNDGNGNPSSIKTIEICEAVLAEFDTIGTKAIKKKEIKEK